MNNKIQHIVYLMLENRSFDHLLGWLYDDDEPKHFIPAASPGRKIPPYNGLNTGTYSNPDVDGNRVYASKISSADAFKVPNVDPNEPFEHVQKQIANNMQGFIRDFASETADPNQIMQCYTPDSLPVLNYLARHYAVSDTYYSSIPTQTNCNRAFSLTGNSIGYYYDCSYKKVAMVDNYWTHGEDGFGMPYEFTEKTIWNVLFDNGYDSPDDDWAVFYSQKWPGLSFYEGNYCFTRDLLWPNLQDKGAHFKDIQQFIDLAEQGNLPKFSYLEPVWYEEWEGYGHSGTDYHPPENLFLSEFSLLRIYAALRQSPKWENTLFIINFDEHGGTYDHVEPPATIAPWENPADGTARPELSPEHPFDFKRLGVRVPLILVSPLIEPGTVFRPEFGGVFDHTSVIATILEQFGIPRHLWGLGSRTAHAPSFGNVFAGNEPIARDEFPESILMDRGSNSVSNGSKDMPITDLHFMIGYRFVWREAQQKAYTNERFHDLAERHFRNIETMTELNDAIGTALKEKKEWPTT